MPGVLAGGRQAERQREDGAGATKTERCSHRPTVRVSHQRLEGAKKDQRERRAADTWISDCTLASRAGREYISAV